MERVYVLTGADDKVIAASPEIEPLVKRWKSEFSSLRMMGPDGVIVPVSDEDYELATELATELSHRRRKKATA